MIGRLVALLLAALPNLVPAGFLEPSGVAWHPERGTLFVVGDEGQVAELDGEGTLLGEIFALEGAHCRRDLEAVAVDPRTGHLLLAVEPSWEVIVWDPEESAVVRRLSLPGSPGPCADPYWGIEGLTVVGPDPDRDGWLIVLAAKQSRPAEYLEVSLPPLDTAAAPVLISRDEAPVSSISDILLEPGGEVLWVLEGFRGRLHRFSGGQAAGVFFLPFPLAEGLAFGPDGALWIADDTGGLYRLENADALGAV